MNNRVARFISFAYLCACLLPAKVLGDDIDIYLNRATAGSAVTRLMLALDFRRGVNPVFCANAASVDCRSRLGKELYSALDIYGTGHEDGSGQAARRGADGVPDQQQKDPRDHGMTLADSYWAAASVFRPDVLRAVLRVVLSGASARLAGQAEHAGLEVGVMVPHENTCQGAGPGFLADYTLGAASACSRGAYILQGFVSVADQDLLNRLFEKVAAVPDPGYQAPWMRVPLAGHPVPIRDVYLELFRYLTGQAVFNGFLGADDYGSQMVGNLYHDLTGSITNDVVMMRPGAKTGQPLLAPDTRIMEPGSFNLAADYLAKAQYISPLRQSGQCARFVLVNTVFGSTASAHHDTTAALAASYEGGGLMPGEFRTGDVGDIAVVAALNQADLGSSVFPGMPDVTGIQGVRSHFLTDRSSRFFDKLAAAGGTGRARLVNEARVLLDTMEQIFNEVLAQNSTLVAATVASGLSGPTSTEKDIYFTLFQPSHRPRWSGNIKKLKLLVRNSAQHDGRTLPLQQLIVQAPLSDPPVHALSNEDGRIRHDALTFWTDPSGADVQDYDVDAGESFGTDGRSVERGGAGQRIPGYLENTVGDGNDGPGARQLFTEDPVNQGLLLPLDAGTPDLSGIDRYLDPRAAMTDTEKRQLIRWIRGQDAFDEDGDGQLRESRAWLMGDILHSRPVAINYGARPGTGYSKENPDIRLVFGSNDGFLRLVKNTEQGGPSRESGRESWGFIPLDLLPMQAVLADQVPAGPAHPYGMDGEVVVHIRDHDRDGNIEVGDGDLVWIFMGQRRGGKSIYAFDISDPDIPVFKWKIDAETSGFQQLAMTFSTPQVVNLGYAAGMPRTALVFAGGYNGGWIDSLRTGKDAGAGPDIRGNAIYVVDADSGELIWRAVGPGDNSVTASSERIHFNSEMVHSIAADITVIDSNYNGLADRAYVGDTGGNIWRVELTEHAEREPESESSALGNWSVRKLASFGGSASADRRFFHAADYVGTRDRQGEYGGLLIVSGNRAAPREEFVENYAYLIKDRTPPARATGPLVPVLAPLVHDDLVDITQRCATGEEPDCLAEELELGWKLQLKGAGEKGFSRPLVSNGTVMFTTFLPRSENSVDHCLATEGAGRAYALKLANGAARFRLAGESPEHESVSRFEAIGPGLPGGIIPLGDKVLIPGRGFDGQQLFTVPGRTRWRAYWRQSGIDVP